MLLPSEVEARALIPSLRAMIAKKLVLQNGMPQQRVATLLGVTQAAVSNYLRETRGRSLGLEDSKEIREVTDEIVSLMMQGVNTVAIMSKFNAAASLIKGRRLLCHTHGRLEPELDIESCHVCDS